MTKYGFGIEVHYKLADLYSILGSIEIIFDKLILEMSKLQQLNKMAIASYHKDISSVVLTFDSNSRIIDQNRHYFPFVE